MSILKLNRPLIINGEPIYPLVSIDQIIKTDGSRLEDENGKINADLLDNKNILDIIDMIYPVGSIYMSVNNVNPANLFGGTWEQIKDKFLLSAGDTYSAGNTGGNATHTLTTAELPKNIGNFVALRWASNVGESGAFSYVQRHADQGGVSGGTNWGDALYTLSGGGQAHSNMPPYLTVFVWKRTA